MPGINIREDGPSKIPTYKDAVKKSIKWRICWKEDQRKTRFNNSSIEERYKKEIWQEVKHEIKENFDAIKDYEENIKKDYESKMNMPISDDDMLDIRGHGQQQEY